MRRWIEIVKYGFVLGCHAQASLLIIPLWLLICLKICLNRIALSYASRVFLRVLRFPFKCLKVLEFLFYFWIYILAIWKRTFCWIDFVRILQSCIKFIKVAIWTVERHLLLIFNAFFSVILLLNFLILVLEIRRISLAQNFARNKCACKNKNKLGFTRTT